MSMNQLEIRGGYGEHGRSCFLLPLEGERFCMLDCGIMDTDPNPFPQVDPEILKKTEYLFLSHCHKDHSGAFSHFRSLGFHGRLITTEPTLRFSGIDWEDTLLLDCPSETPAQPVFLEDGLSFSYGKTGHCAGSVWFHLFRPSGSLIYSGDYQKRTLTYAVDPIEGRKADLAILDCAHNGEQGNADELRRRMTDRIRETVREGRRVILPLPKYGRGMEMICMLPDSLPDARIALSAGMRRSTEDNLVWESWLKPEAAKKIRRFLDTEPEKAFEQDTWDILLLADTHLEQPENIRTVRREADRGALVLLTGRLKKGCLTEQLYREGKACIMAYPHHQSRTDLEEMIRQNGFSVVLPFHNNRKEVFWG